MVAAVCRRVMPHGFLLLDSGDSYHACGIALLAGQERPEFLGRSLFFSPIVDSAYVAHQLVQPMRNSHFGRRPASKVPRGLARRGACLTPSIMGRLATRSGDPFQPRSTVG